MFGFIHTWFDISDFDIYKKMNNLRFDNLHHFYLQGFESVNKLIYRYLCTKLRKPNVEREIPMCFTHSKYHGLLLYHNTNTTYVMIDLLTSMNAKTREIFNSICSLDELIQLNNEYADSLHNIALIVHNDNITDVDYFQFSRNESAQRLSEISNITGTVVILRNTDITIEDIHACLDLLNSKRDLFSHTQKGRQVPQFVQCLIDKVLYGKPICCTKNKGILNVVDIKLGRIRNDNSESINVQHELYENIADCLSGDFFVEEELIKDINIICKKSIAYPHVITKNVKELNKNEWTRQLVGYTLFSNIVNTIIECKHHPTKKPSPQSLKDTYRNYISEFNEMFSIPNLPFNNKQLFIIYVTNDDRETVKVEDKGYICSRSNIRKTVEQIRANVIQHESPYRSSEKWVNQDNKFLCSIRGLEYNQNDKCININLYNDLGHYNKFMMIT